MAVCSVMFPLQGIRYAHFGQCRSLTLIGRKSSKLGRAFQCTKFNADPKSTHYVLSFMLVFPNLLLASGCLWNWRIEILLENKFGPDCWNFIRVIWAEKCYSLVWRVVTSSSLSLSLLGRVCSWWPAYSLYGVGSKLRVLLHSLFSERRGGGMRNTL
jgi:hypothetical protein